MTSELYNQTKSSMIEMLKNLKEIQKVLDYSSKDKHNFFEYEDTHLLENLKAASKLNVRVFTQKETIP